MAGNLIYIGIVLFIIAIIAYVLGAQGVAGMTASLGKTLLIIGVILAIIFIVLSFVTGGNAPAVLNGLPAISPHLALAHLSPA